jgi:hypothetical protein
VALEPQNGPLSMTNSAITTCMAYAGRVQLAAVSIRDFICPQTKVFAFRCGCNRICCGSSPVVTGNGRSMCDTRGLDCSKHSSDSKQLLTLLQTLNSLVSLRLSCGDAQVTRPSCNAQWVQ